MHFTVPLESDSMNSITRSLLLLTSITTLLIGCSYLPQVKPEPIPSITAQIPASEPSQPIKKLILGQNDDGSYNNLWDRVRNGYGLPAVNDNKINKDLQWYAKNQRYVTRFTSQSQPYLHHVVTRMESNGLPLELALIPIIESAYNPSATSPANNVGLWQFTLQTAKNFGLKHSKLYNGRKDVVASTDAAIRYLKKLHTMFDNDWLLAIAAYNAGEGTVKKAIAKNRRAGKPTDFWSLPLPKHTQEYLPKLIALSKIVADPQRYNLTIAAIPDTPYFVEINVATQINILQAAKQANLDADKLKQLNAGLNSWATDPSVIQSLLVPVTEADAFTLQLKSLPKLEASQPQVSEQYKDADPTTPSKEYKVKSGDSLWTIAKKQKISLQKLMQLNNLNPKSIVKPGQKLNLE